MSKRRLSQSLRPTSKRILLDLGSEEYSWLPAVTRISFDNAFYDELILHIFSHLSWIDLCNIQTVNKTWARLAADNELWKALYIKEYGRSRLRGARGFVTRNDGREIKSLPERGNSHLQEHKDWKWMFRISSNWRTGRCYVEGFNFSSMVDQALRESQDRTHILLTGNLTITASSSESALPSITMYAPGHPAHTFYCKPTRSQALFHITSLAVDQSPPDANQVVRMASFLSSGVFIVYNIQYPSLQTSTMTYVPSVTNSRNTPIVQAVYHHPLLVTLSKAFCVSLYDLSNGSIFLVQTLTSFTSFHPTSLVLSSPSPATHKLVMVYTVPVYPNHWSVGATELIISSNFSSPIPKTSRISVTGTRTARAFEVPQGWIDEAKMRSMREQWGRKVLQISDVQTDGKWVVLAPNVGVPHLLADGYPSSPSTSDSESSASSSSAYIASSSHSPNNLQLYRLSLPSSTSASLPKLTFIRNLYGHMGPVSSLSVADGRCVSLGVNGRIWVWDLENGSSTEVTDSNFGKTAEGSYVGKRSVVFDERRIITGAAGSVTVRRFDI